MGFILQHCMSQAAQAEMPPRLPSVIEKCIIKSRSLTKGVSKVLVAFCWRVLSICLLMSSLGSLGVLGALVTQWVPARFPISLSCPSKPAVNVEVTKPEDD